MAISRQMERKKYVIILLSLRYHQTRSETQIGHSIRNTDRRIQESQDEQLNDSRHKAFSSYPEDCNINGLGVLVWVRDNVSVPQYCS